MSTIDTHKLLRGNTLEHLEGQKRAQGQELSILFLCALDFNSKVQPLRRTSIIATVGPATHSVDAMVKLRKAGMEIMRMNFSHGQHEYHQESIDFLRKSFEMYPSNGHTVGIALDTKGPEIRTGITEDSAGIKLAAGDVVKLSNTKNKEACNSDVIYVDYHALCSDLEENDAVLFDDGNLSMRVLKINEAESYVECVCLNSWVLKSRKGVTLVGKKLNLPFLSEKDKADIEFGIKAGVNFIFASFTQSGEDIQTMRDYIGGRANIAIIAKIENEAGCNNISEILDTADGIMVARGDLGVALPPEKVFLAQKSLIARANVAGKAVICATQMLDSMTSNPRPTRAEAADVANAIIDGADCVMLSGETAVGRYPVESVAQMSSICCQAEAAVPNRRIYDELKLIVADSASPGEAIGMAAVSAALSQRADVIIVLTETGLSASLVAKYRPPCPILCVTRNVDTAHRLTLHRGCFPVLYSDLEWESENKDHPIHTGLSRWWGMSGVMSGVEHALQFGRKNGLLSRVKNVKAVVVYGVIDVDGESVPAMRITTYSLKE